MDLTVFRGFCAELKKLAANKSLMSVAQTRSGRRSMSVDTMLKKDKEGTLFKVSGPDKKGDVPSMDGSAPGREKREFGLDNVTVLPTSESFSSNTTGPQARQ